MTFRTRSFVLIAIVVLLLALAGCNSASYSGSTPTPTPAQSSQPVAITVSDDPGTSVVSFTVTIQAITLVSSSGAAVPLVTAPATIEFTHLAGTSTPVGTANVPAGTYTRAEVTLANPVVTYINPSTGQPVQKTLNAAPITVPVPLNPALVVGSTAMAINFDLSVFGSVNIDAAGNVTFTPQITPFHQPVPPVPPLPPLPTPLPIGTQFEHVTGTVAVVSGSSFTITVGTRTLKFAT